MPTSVVLLWLVAFVLSVGTVLVITPTQCYATGTLAWRWPNTQLWVPTGVGPVQVATAVLATLTALREQRGARDRTDGSAVGRLAAAVVVLGLLVLVGSYG